MVIRRLVQISGKYFNGKGEFTGEFLLENYGNKGRKMLQNFSFFFFLILNMTLEKLRQKIPQKSICRTDLSLPAILSSFMSVQNESNDIHLVLT